MVCKECGKEITDKTLGYCPECLAPLDEPVVINMSKDDIKKANKELERKEKELQKKADRTIRENAGQNIRKETDKNKKYEGPAVNLIGYIKSLKSSFTNLLTFIGTVLLYLSPFFPWIWETLHETHKKGDLFDIAGKNADTALNTPILGAMAILILVSAFAMLLFSAREYLKFMWKYRNNFILRIIPCITASAAFAVIFTNKNYETALKGMKDLKNMAKSMNQANVYSYGRGLGPIFCVSGIVLCFIAIVFDFIDYKKNK